MSLNEYRGIINVWFLADSQEEADQILDGYVLGLGNEPDIVHVESEVFGAVPEDE